MKHKDDFCPPITFERGEKLVDCKICANCQDCIPGYEHNMLLVS